MDEFESSNDSIKSENAIWTIINIVYQQDLIKLEDLSTIQTKLGGMLNITDMSAKTQSCRPIRSWDIDLTNWNSQTLWSSSPVLMTVWNSLYQWFLRWYELRNQLIRSRDMDSLKFPFLLLLCTFCTSSANQKPRNKPSTNQNC